MDKLNPDALVTFLWVAAALIAFTLSIWTLVEKIHKARKPAAALASWQQETENKLSEEDSKINSLEEGQKVLCRGILALLSHEINGNSVDKLTQAQNTLTEYLIEK